MPRIVGKGEPLRVTELPRSRRPEDGALRATLMSRLVTVSDLLRDTASVEAAAAAIGRAALMLTGASRGAVFLRLPNGVVTCLWSHNLSDEYISRLCTPADANPWAHLSHYPELACMDLSARGRARTTAPSIVEDIRTLPAGNETRRAAEREGLRALCSWPVGRKGRVFGAIAYYFDAAHSCTDPEREVALAFTLQAAATLEQAMAGEKPARASSHGGLFGGVIFGKRHIERLRTPPVEPEDTAEDETAPEPPADADAESQDDAAADLAAAAPEHDLEVESDAERGESDVDADSESGVETDAARIAALQRALETEAGRLWSERTNLGVEREQLASARRDLDAERGRLAETRREVNSEQERLAEARRTLDGERGRLTEAQNAQAAETARIAGARGDLEAEQTRMAAARKTLEAERAQLETARQSVDAERDKVAALRKETDAALARLAENQREFDAETARLATLRGELDAERGRLAGLRAELDAREAQIDQFRHEMEAERARGAAELERERSEVRSVQGTFTAAEAEIAQRRTALEEEWAHLAQVRREIDADRDRLSEMARSVEAGTGRVADVPAATAATVEAVAPPTPAPHREVGMVPSRETVPAPPPAIVLQAAAPWAPPEAPQAVETSKVVGPAQASIPVQTTKANGAKAAAPAKAAPAAKSAPTPKQASAPKPAPAPKPASPPKPAKNAPNQPQPAKSVTTSPPDSASVEKYRERVATWAVAAARALACQEQDIADLQEAARLYEVEPADGAAPGPGIGAILENLREQWNGKGGPKGLAGQEIPLGARILAVTVAYAEMVIGRPGSPMLYYLDAKAALKRNAGAKYDPDVVKAFCRVVNRA